MIDQDLLDSVGTQFLTFLLGSEEYAVNITDIQEVRAWEGVNALPRTPKYVAGIISLRGSVIPIIDLRIRLGMDARDYDSNTVVAILRMSHGESDQQVGIVVDSVSDVLNTSKDNIKSPPEFVQTDEAKMVAGLIPGKGRMVILLNTGNLISRQEMVGLDQKIKMYASMAGDE